MNDTSGSEKEYQDKHQLFLKITLETVAEKTVPKNFPWCAL